MHGHGEIVPQLLDLVLLMVLDSLASVQVTLHRVLSGVGRQPELVKLGFQASKVVLCLSLLVDGIPQFLVETLSLTGKELNVVTAHLCLMCQLVSFTDGSSLARFSLVKSQILVLELSTQLMIVSFTLLELLMQLLQSVCISFLLRNQI